MLPHGAVDRRERWANNLRARHPLGDIHTFAGFDQVRAWEEEFLPAEELEKYEASVGHQPTRQGQRGPA